MGKQSLYQQLHQQATLTHEAMLADIDIAIRRRDALRHAFHYRRAGDPEVKVTYSSPAALYITAYVEAYDPKAFWLMAEQFFDTLGLPLHQATEDRQSTVHEIWQSDRRVLYCFRFQTKTACVPIYRKVEAAEKTEIIGYSCA